MASQQITITISDTAEVTLAQGRDYLMIAWDYESGGGIGWNPVNTNQDKLNFIKAYIAKFVRTSIKNQIRTLAIEAASAANNNPDVDVQ